MTTITQSVEAIRKWQRHWLLRQFGDNGLVLPESIELSRHIDSVLSAISPSDYNLPTDRFEAFAEMLSALRSVHEWFEDGSFIPQVEGIAMPSPAKALIGPRLAAIRERIKSAIDSADRALVGQSLSAPNHPEPSEQPAR